MIFWESLEKQFGPLQKTVGDSEGISEKERRTEDIMTSICSWWR